ncbi:unnamed protein product [Danaus chrysippus]|uniref:(African queen) hypothetical protein n=1 Tax=Danaus chrysippus TaxID=151541 RepID=A0A8J2VSL9_9NEOP|nr:unnamed protein product [Danaus chrysippus]
MSKSLENRDNIFKKIQEFVCHMYGFNFLKKVNETRVALFEKTYKFLDTETFKLPKKDDDDENITADSSDSDSGNESERDGCDSSQNEAEND